MKLGSALTPSLQHQRIRQGSAASSGARRTAATTPLHRVAAAPFRFGLGAAAATAAAAKPAAPAAPVRPLLRRNRRAATVTPRALFSAPQQQAGPSDAYARLRGVQVIRCDDGARVDLPSLWASSGERAVVVWARTFGCPFCW